MSDKPQTCDFNTVQSGLWEAIKKADLPKQIKAITVYMDIANQFDKLRVFTTVDSYKIGAEITAATEQIVNGIFSCRFGFNDAGVDMSLADKHSDLVLDKLFNVQLRVQQHYKTDSVLPDDSPYHIVLAGWLLSMLSLLLIAVSATNKTVAPNGVALFPN